jgi:protein ImuB
MLWVALHFASLPPQALEPTAAWACQFTPRVSLEPPRELLLEVEASLRYFGGRAAFLKKLAAGLAQLDFPVSLATARTPRAALWLARSGAANLHDVPLEVTGFELELCKSIGISILGELLQLPREGLAQRCPQAVLDDLDRALGNAPEPRALFSPPPRFAATLELPAEVTHAEGVLFGARRLLVQLEGLLAARHAGVRHFALSLIQRKSKVKIPVGLASPARHAERLLGLLRERLASVSLGEPIEAIGLETEAFVPLNERSAGMFGDRAAADEGWACLLERLQARLGREAVHGLTAQPDHRPEYAWRKVDPGEWDPREFSAPGPRPLWLLEAPRRLGEQDFELLAGPERIESGWWDGDEARRDYFIAGRDGALLWVYRETDAWYLHGIFA